MRETQWAGGRSFPDIFSLVAGSNPPQGSSGFEPLLRSTIFVHYVSFCNLPTRVGVLCAAWGVIFVLHMLHPSFSYDRAADMAHHLATRRCTIERRLRAARLGDARAQYNLGLCYAKGKGVEQDHKEAVRWYRLAADQGDAAAQNALALCYANGKGVEEDVEEAVRLYSLAVDQGYTRAYMNLGNCYLHGRGVVQDYHEAVRLYRLAIAQGNDGAGSMLGICYQYGYGVARNEEEAVRLYRLAADYGYAAGQCNLGLCYAQGVGVAQNTTEAMRWLHCAADRGDRTALAALRSCVLAGQVCTLRTSFYCCVLWNDMCYIVDSIGPSESTMSLARVLSVFCARCCCAPRYACEPRLRILYC